MIDKIINYADRLSEERLSAKVKTLLNLLFVASLTSALFKKIYFDYDLIPWNDYQGYYQYFIDGYFLVPLSLFYILWYITDLPPRVLFTICVHRIDRKYRNKIKAYVRAKYTGLNTVDSKIEDQLALFIKTSKVDWLYELLKEANKSISAIGYTKLLRWSREMQLRYERDFVLLFRALLAITIYFKMIPYFGWVLYGVVFLIVVTNGFILFIAYQIAELFPSVIGSIGEIWENLKGREDEAK